MDKAQIKDKYERFRQWQKKPRDYKLLSDEMQHCNNCGNDFTGNFCPICSQKAGIGRIGWRSVRQGVMDIWGLGTRSLLYSIWQLLLRPGHLISDYISGKRQVSFPPVKMLFIIAVLYSMLYYWLLPKAMVNISYDEMKAGMQAFDDFSMSIKNNYSWFSLIMALLAVLPTWFMFRYSPRHTAHTLPEGFFIQVFLAVIMLVLCFLLMPLVLVDLFLYSYLALFILGIYYIIVYKYLFGYGLWGTLWRSGFILLGVFVLGVGAILILFDIDFKAFVPQITELSDEQLLLIKNAYGYGSLFVAAMLFITGYVINLIATRKERKLQNLQRQ